ncbi:hypothetical protein [Nocardia terpenica]|uniref:Uncharacterized protein n=1 Tax=Nocardia terpenica TaxID=455432 RepID=A0A6G9Z0Z0_9NOCA|nr:hypothetical protein [Nocardia terpenica]QIS19279.1 hypothetical protein F6W96_14290 [Nocardia terpenica]
MVDERPDRSRGTGVNHIGPTAVTHEVLTRAAKLGGIDSEGAVTIRDGSHAVYELPGRIVARIGTPHSFETAQPELRIS